MVIEIKDRMPKAGRRPIISDNADLEVTFVFDEEWNGLEKVARFVLEDKTYKDVLLQDDKCMIPSEVCRPGHLLIGVIGGDIATTSIDVLVQPSIIAKSGELLGDVNKDALSQLLKLLNKYSKVAPAQPTAEGYIGEIVWNSEPIRGEFVGWVYTADGGWQGFGAVGITSVPKEDNTVTAEGTLLLSDGRVYTTSDGMIFTSKEE